MLIYREETFGPVAPVIVFDDDDEAIAMANDTDYGLASYVYTNSLSTARSGRWSSCSSGWWASTTSIPTSAAAPFGGVKQSGLGVEGAREGIDEYLDTKLVGLSI